MNLDEIGLRRDGYFFGAGFSEEDLKAVISRLGHVRVDDRSPDPVREISPQSIDLAKTNTLSSRYGAGQFPFHTDAAHWEKPARYLVLYCVNPGGGARPTLLQDSNKWHFSDAEIDLACRAIWRTGHIRTRLCMFAEFRGGELAIRYDRDCMRPMTNEARELDRLIEQKLSHSESVQIQWEKNCLLVIDNHRMVHARGLAKRPDANRTLKRILIGGN